MDNAKPPLLPTLNWLNSLFSSSPTSHLLPSAKSPPAAQQSEKQQGSTTLTTAAASICKRIRSRNGKGASSSPVLVLVMLDLWGVVSIITLITTIATAPTTVSAASIAAVSVASNAYGDGNKGNNGVSGNFGNHQPGKSPQPSKLSFHTGNDAKGNASHIGVLNLPFGELMFSNRLQNEQEKKEMGKKSIKNKGAAVVKREVGDTRITSNQDVTTLALAVDNSSSVAIANINSSFNNVYVSIGSNSFPNRYDSASEMDSDEDEMHSTFGLEHSDMEDDEWRQED